MPQSDPKEKSSWVVLLAVGVLWQSVQVSVCSSVCPCGLCMLFCWHGQPRRAGEALTLLSFSLPGPREIPLFVYIELCRLVALPGSPAYCCNIEAAGDLHSKLDLETQITPALWFLSVCVCVEGRLFLLIFLQFSCHFWPFGSVCLCEFCVCTEWKKLLIKWKQFSVSFIFIFLRFFFALQLAKLCRVLSSSHSQCHKQPQPLAGVALRCTDMCFPKWHTPTCASTHKH